MQKISKTKLIADKYMIFEENKLGQGSSGIVYRGCMKDNKNIKIAVKIISRSCTNTNRQQQIIQSFDREQYNLKSLNSKYVVKIIDTFNDNSHYYLILEYCEQGSLAQKLRKIENKRLPVEEAMKCFCQIVEGYGYLYRNNIVHRDLKPENILFHQDITKIADFGFSRILEDMDEEQQLTLLGTPIYTSPEILQGKEYSSNTDIWSLGCILFEMIYGVNAFNISSPSIFKLIEQQEKPIKFPQEPQLDNKIIELIKLMLKPNPQDRLSWTQLFVHPLIILYQQKLNMDQGLLSIIRPTLPEENDIKEVSKQINHFIKYELEKRDFQIKSIIEAIPISKQCGQSNGNLFILFLAVLKILQLSSENFRNLVNGNIHENFNAEQWKLYKKSDKFFDNMNKFNSHQKIVDTYIQDYFPHIPDICDKLNDINLIKKIKQYKDYTQNDDSKIVKTIYLELMRQYLRDLIICYKKNDQMKKNKQVLWNIITIHQLMEMGIFTQDYNVQKFKADLQQTPISELISKIESIYTKL